MVDMLLDRHARNIVAEHGSREDGQRGRECVPKMLLQTPDVRQEHFRVIFE